MNFEIRFSESVYKDQTKLSFDEFWNPKLKNKIRDIVVGLCFIMLGMSIIIGKSNIGFIFLFVGSVILFRFYKLNKHYNEHKRRYFQAIEEELLERKEKNEISLWEFNDEYLRYKDYKQDSKIIWTAFSQIRKFGNTIYLDTEIGICFSLSEIEVGSENFANIISFVEEKINKTCC